MKKKWLCILMAIIIFMVNTAPLYAEESKEENSDKTHAPYFSIDGADTSVDKFPLKETKVSTNINGVIAETYVTQTYANEGKNPINASYVFPASTKVTVHGMKMQIGDQVVTATIKEKEEAKEEFEQAKSEGKSASLLEEKRPNVSSMNVANIMPGDIVHIELHYTELLVSTEGIYEFVFPTVVGPRYVSPSDDVEDEQTDGWVETPYIEDGETHSGKYDIDVKLSTGVPITDLTSKSHKVEIAYNNEATADVSLSNPEDFAGNRDFILNYKLTGQELSSGLMLHEGETENFFMMMVQPPERYKPEDIPPREYIFVLDISGSMYGYPLDTAKELITDLVSNLRETDLFNLILFSGGSYQMAPKSFPATAKNVKKAIRIIDEQEGGGGTELAPALESAIAIPTDENVARSVVIITDGFIYGEKEIFEIVSNNTHTTNFFPFGIGSSVNRHLMEGIAKAGLGEAFIVTEPTETASTAERFRTYIESPILTNINVTFTDFDAYDIEPPNVPTLFAQRPIVIFGKWRGEPTGTITITGKTGGEDYIHKIKVSEIEPSESNQSISYLWARTKVDRLVDFSGPEANLAAIQKEVTAIGLKYSMLTPYTSFISVIDTVRNTDKDADNVKQPSPLPLHVSDLAVGYTIGSEPGTMLLIFAMVSMLCINILWRWRKKKSADADMR